MSTPRASPLSATRQAAACLVLADPGEEYDPELLRRRVARDGVTVLQTVPGVLRLLLDGPVAETCRTLRWLCSGGEALPPELPDRLFGLLDVELFNFYGP